MSEQLNRYNQKRNFERTLEPKGITENSEEDLRFVVQHHIASRDHYDLRLEWNGVLLSWAVPKGPSYNTIDKRLAVKVEDHPLEYRNFEGTIPQNEYGGGVVMLWDEGYWEPYVDVEEGLSNGMLKFTLKGKRLKGKWALVRIKASGNKNNNWLFLKEKDEFVKSSNGISEFITSVRTGRTMSEIAKGTEDKIIKNPFNKVSVQLAKLVKNVPEGEDWLYEMKYDGYRIIAFVEGSNVRLITRNGNDFTKRFYDIALSLSDFAKEKSMVLDGEVVITDETGKTDFQALQNYMKNKKVSRLTYIIFDLLALNGVDLRGELLTKRKEILENLFIDVPNNLFFSRHVRGHGQESFAAACEAGMEGIIGKKANSVYSGTRNDWIKLKCDKRQEFVIGGYTLSDKRASGVSSLLLGVYEGEDLEYAGRAGTGISESDMRMLESKFEKIKRINSPFKLTPKAKVNEKITWLEPILAAEIKFAEWTKDNLLRQASFKGLRVDKNPKDIKRDKVEDETDNVKIEVQEKNAVDINKGKLIIEGITITNPSKIIFDDPIITKEDVIQYYLKVSERMLPYVSNRILSIVRCPKGVSEACFYKKHPGPNNIGIYNIGDYFYIENRKGLIGEAQMGTLEFHIWGSRVDELDKPDMMVFDLDPDEGMDLSKVRQGVEDIKSILNELSLKSYLKTSGGKGYHVVVPFKPVVNWDIFRNFARGVAEVMENKWPDRYTSNIRKAKRANKIFIDWIRNARGATSIAPYSLRARKGANVSMPISWNELYKVSPDGVSMEDALLRIERDDPWKGFFQNNQMLK